MEICQFERYPAPGDSHKRFQTHSQAPNFPPASSQGYRLLADREASPQLSWEPATHKASGAPELHLHPYSMLPWELPRCQGLCQPPLRVTLSQKRGAGLQWGPSPPTCGCFNGEMHSEFPSDQAIK